jgi:hypothetical protein
MSSWTDESKAALIEKYKAKNPTAENSAEIVKELAVELDTSANAVRMILIQAGAYVKTAPATGDKKATAGSGSAGKKPTKEVLHAALTKAIEDAGHTADQDIISKLTGKAAEYLTKIITEGKVESEEE